MPLTLDQYRRALAAEPGQLPVDVVECVLQCFESYLRAADNGVTLDRAFGGFGPSGGDPWFVKLSRERRDRRYRSIADAVCPDGTLEEKTDAVRRELRRTSSSGGPLREHLDVIRRESKLCGMPDSPETIRKILAAQVAENTKEPVVFLKPAQIPE